MLLVVPALHRGGDWFARIGLAGSMLAVVLSGSRGALLGLAVAGAGLAAMRLLRRRVRSGSRPLQPTGVASWTAVAIVAVSIGVAFAVPAVRSRLLLTDSGASGTVQGRGLLWSESLRLWTEHPWLGTGPSGFVDAITAQHTEEWATQVGSANPPDSPHSWPLQALLSGGPLLLALALVLGTMVVWSGWRAFGSADPTTRSVSNAIVGGGALAAVVGFGVALLTHFTTASTTILVSLLCGALVSSAHRPARGQRRDAGVSRLLGSALAAAVGAALLVATAAEWSMERAISAVERGDSQTADEAFQMSERLRPWDADVALLAATALSRQSMTEPSHPERNGLDPASLSVSALSWAERAVDRLPESSEAALALATAQEGVGDLTAALRTYQGLRSLSPTNASASPRAPARTLHRISCIRTPVRADLVCCCHDRDAPTLDLRCCRGAGVGAVGGAGAAHGADSGRVGRSPGRLADRVGSCPRRTAARRPVAGRATHHVRPRGRRAPTALLVRRRRRAAPSDAPGGKGPAERPLCGRTRRAVRQRGTVFVPQRIRQRGVARTPDRSRCAHGHHGRDPVRRLCPDVAASPSQWWDRVGISARPRGSDRDGRQLPADVGTRRAQDPPWRRPPGQRPVQAVRSRLTSAVIAPADRISLPLG